MDSTNIYTIYRAINTVNGKVYVGFDSNWPLRQTQHLRRYTKTRFNLVFYDALRKYGADAFSWDVIYQSKDRDHTINVMEPYFISEFCSLAPNGYNMTRGGDGGSTNKTRIEVDGIVYDTITEAAATLRVSVITVKRKLDDDHYPTWKRLSLLKTKQVVRTTPIEIDGKRYESKTDAAREHGISVLVLNNRLKARRVWSTWKQLTPPKKKSYDLNKLSFKCPHCDVASNSLVAMKRWHFDRCPDNT